MDLASGVMAAAKGDAFLFKKTLEREAGGDRQHAQAYVSALQKEAGKLIPLSWILIVIGIPFILMLGLGILMIVFGVANLRRANKVLAVSREGFELWQADHP